jgi:tRNA (mo5U34)-methyltransferase
MTKEEIREELTRLAPFAHEIDLPFGLTTHVPELSRRELERVRLRNLKALLWPALLDHLGGSLAGLRVLDAGCNCGGFSVAATQSGADHVLGIDVVDRYIEQANFIKSALGLENAAFQQLAVEELDPEKVGRFDVTLCLGLLYHFENPVLSMKRLAAVTGRTMVIDTDLEVAEVNGAYWRMEMVRRSFDSCRDVTTGLWRKKRGMQFIPTAHAVEELLAFLGFSSIVRLGAPDLGDSDLLDDRYEKGKRATFICTRE